MRSVSIYLYVVLFLFVGISCSKFRKIEKSQDWRVKYDAALNYYNKKDFYKASVLFEQIIPIVRGLPEGEKVQFSLANCQFQQKLFLLASEQFRTFYETYGRSSLAEEARFMYAYSLYESSPNPNLDQTSSIDAMSAMQQFLNRYPNSAFRERAIEVILSTQVKLEKKGFENAYQYYKMRSYKASIVALGNFIDNFPDSEYLERAYYLVIVSEYKLAEQSIFTKQLDRYKEVVEHYKEFVDKYPGSTFLSDAEKLYASSLEKINKSKFNNS
ncbi:MAG: outer membrane protein assembly factor BamD [Cyclobacteriaceae bacterium]|jgi:outer membrane protein assembly factor BamD|nr:outer membrane protein assembly factor BamD [Cyclobacteriaceae bacterium]MDH4297712.1 outer membrane protein assembly factor BamD [Cyclobacteriaceae bacterium]MDH5250424.1 outer membrane protein assembly factor BamD [Cyclobacteriaceae bacterium]